MEAVAHGFAHCPMWSSLKPLTLGFSGTAWQHLNVLFLSPLVFLCLSLVYIVPWPVVLNVLKVGCNSVKKKDFCCCAASQSSVFAKHGAVLKKDSFTLQLLRVHKCVCVCVESSRAAIITLLYYCLFQHKCREQHSHKCLSVFGSCGFASLSAGFSSMVPPPCTCHIHLKHIFYVRLLGSAIKMKFEFLCLCCVIHRPDLLAAGK